MATKRRASVAFVLVTLGLDALGVGIIAPIVPGLVQELAHLPPERAAPWVGALIAAYAAVQFFGSPLLGELSDRFGRRPVILASVFGLGCDYVLLALAPTLWWLFAGRLIAGATSANVAAATAYISDVSRQEDRARAVRPDRRHLRGRLRDRPGAGRLPGRLLAAPAVHRRGRAVLRSTSASASSCCPKALPPTSAARSTWSRANPFNLLSCIGPRPSPGAPRDGLVLHLDRPRRRPEQPGAVHRLPLRLGPATQRRAARRRRPVAGGGRGLPAAPRHRPHRRARHRHRRLRRRAPRLRDPGGRPRRLDRGPCGGADRARRPGHAVGPRHGGRAAAGRQPGRDAGPAVRRRRA